MRPIGSGKRMPFCNSAAASWAAISPSVRNNRANQSNDPPSVNVRNAVMINDAPVRWPRSRTSKRTCSGHVT